MIQFVRTFFGLNGSSSNRTVVGNNVSFDSKEIIYIQESNKRLTALLNLSKRYKGTPHEEKIKSVYEKTKKIHGFLIFKKKIYELELFHIQNTENFINAFTLIIDVEQRHKDSIFSNLVTEPEAASIKESEVRPTIATVESKNGRSKGELYEIVEKAKSRNKQGSTLYTDEPGIEVPTLAIPEISIHTNAKLFYLKEDALGKQVPNEISFISTSEEKEIFQSYVSNRLGMKDIYYVGNARINIPNNKGTAPKEMVPVIYWGKNLYALTLQDYRIFPVTINRKSL